MKESFTFTSNAILPIIIIVFLGYYIGHTGKWSSELFNKINSLCFHLFLPISLCLNIYDVESFDSVNSFTFFLCLISIFLLYGIGVLFSKSQILNQGQKGPIIQATFRSNQAILGIPLASFLAGNSGAQLATIYSSFGVPIFNILAVIALTANKPVDGNTVKPNFKDTFKEIVKNPLIRGIFFGLILVGLRLLQVKIFGDVIFSIQNNLTFVYKAASDLGKIATPLMLFALGARINIKSTSSLLKPLSLGLFLRLILAPCIVLVPSILFYNHFHLTPADIAALIGLFATPPAVSSAVMVKEIGGDDQLASQLVAIGTLLSGITMFLISFILRYLGYL